MSVCDHMIELMNAALDGALTADEKMRLEAHLAECPSCSALYRDLNEMRELFLDPVEEAPEGFAEGVMERIRQEPVEGIVPSAPQKRAWRRTAYLAAAVFAVVLIGYGGIHLLTGGNDMLTAGSASDALEDYSLNESPEEGESVGETAPADEGADTEDASSSMQQFASGTPDMSSDTAVTTNSDAGEVTQSDDESDSNMLESGGSEERSYGASGFGIASIKGGSIEDQTWYAIIELTGAAPDELEDYEYTEDDTGRYYIVSPDELDRLEGQLTALGYDLTVVREGTNIDQTAENGLIIVYSS